MEVKEIKRNNFSFRFDEIELSGLEDTSNGNIEVFVRLCHVKG